MVKTLALSTAVLMALGASGNAGERFNSGTDISVQLGPFGVHFRVVMPPIIDIRPFDGAFPPAIQLPGIVVTPQAPPPVVQPVPLPPQAALPSQRVVPALPKAKPAKSKIEPPQDAPPVAEVPSPQVEEAPPIPDKPPPTSSYFGPQPKRPAYQQR